MNPPVLSKSRMLMKNVLSDLKLISRYIGSIHLKARLKTLTDNRAGY